MYFYNSSNITDIIKRYISVAILSPIIPNIIPALATPELLLFIPFTPQTIAIIPVGYVM